MEILVWENAQEWVSKPFGSGVLDSKMQKWSSIFKIVPKDFKMMFIFGNYYLEILYNSVNKYIYL